MQTQPQGSLIPKVRDQFAEFPQIDYLHHTLGFSPRGTCAGSGYRCLRFFLISFSRSPEINWTKQNSAIPRFNQILIIMILLWFILVNTDDDPYQSIPKSQKSNLCHHAYLNSKGILTFFPFPLFKWWTWLGLTIPWLIYIVKEPLPLQWQRFSLC